MAPVSFKYESFPDPVVADSFYIENLQKKVAH